LIQEIVTTNTSGDWSECFQFKPWYPTYLILCDFLVRRISVDG